MWLSEMGTRVRRCSPPSDTTKKKPRSFLFGLEKQPKIGILAFETAKTMSRLVSLYKSLTDDELLKLRNEIIKSEAIANLNTKDEAFLLKLAYKEKIEEIDVVAITVSRLGKKCSNQELNQFENYYFDLKHGMVDSGKLSFGCKEVDKMIKQMEKFITSTSGLYTGLEMLGEMELSEQKLKQWKNYSRSLAGQKTNYDLFDKKISWQRQQVRYLKQVSLWGQTFNKIVNILSRIVCIVYTRISNIFAPYTSVLVLPPSISFRHIRFASQQQTQVYPEALLSAGSSPVSDTLSTKSSLNISKYSIKPIKPGSVKFWSRELKPLLHRKAINVGDAIGFGITFTENRFLGFGGLSEKGKLVHQAPPTTVGGSGLAIRYANVIIITERYLNSPASLNESGREELYQMLPEDLRKLVRRKMKRVWRKEVGNGEASLLAEYWREKLREILWWLAPMAHDTIRWQVERNFEKQDFELKPRVLLLQTLFFADREKTEKAIADVLVRLTWMYRYGLSCCDL